MISTYILSLCVAITYAASNWYSTPEGLRTVRKFHDAYAREPSKEIAEAKKRHQVIIEELKDWLSKNGDQLKRVEYTGSTYEGTKVAGKEMEFDVMFVFKRGEQLDIQVDQRSPRFALLLPKTSTENSPFSKFLVSGYLSPNKVKSRFYGDLQKWLNSREMANPQLKGEMKLHYSGAAIKAEVFHYGTHWYFVDLVPTYEVNHYGSKRLYVAKPQNDKDPSDLTWRHSFSVDEKKALSNIDDKSQCKRQVIRILKVIRDKEAGLKKLDSFYIKVAVIAMSEQQHLDWSVKNLALRLRDTMEYLGGKLLAGDLRHPRDDSINVFIGFDRSVRENMGSRLKRIINSEQEAQLLFSGQRFSKLEL